MKKICISAIVILSLSSLLCASSTTVKFSNPVNQPDNEYGDRIINESVEIETKNYKIDNFWSKFTETKADDSVNASTSTVANLEMTVEMSFACEMMGLDEKGCSGQKPFLINSGYAINSDLQIDAMGNALPAGEFRIPYDSADNYKAANDDAFYALDVYRAPKYYKIDEKPVGNDKKSFFAIIKDFFDHYFSPATETYGDPLDAGSVDARDRYIANIIFGLEKDYRVKINAPVDVTTTNIADMSGTVSLLDYNSQTVSTTTSCSGFILSFNPDTASCKIINFFGMANWMPFFSNNSRQEIETNSVMQDTEQTLLTLAGKLDDENYILSKTTVDETGRRSFIGEIFKPMTSMMSSMFRFFFGSSSKKTTEVISANFEFKNAMPLMFMVTDGVQIIGFEVFKLLGLESVYGTEATSCRVKQKKGFFGWASDYQTFTKDVPTTTKIDMGGGSFLSFLSHTPDYDKLNFTNEKHRKIGDWGHHDVITLTTDDWLDWCKRNQGRQKKGLFGRLFDKITTISNFLLGNSSNGEDYDSQLDGVLQDKDYSVDEYKEKVHHGLILHLEKMDIHDVNVSSPGVVTTYKILSKRKGHMK